MIVYISIGNSDDKLSQAEWSNFVHAVHDEVVGNAETIHGTWDSCASAPWQNACWCVEFKDDESMLRARAELTAIRTEYRQDSAAWAAAVTEFL